MVRYLALCKIVELGSFTRAADVLGYTQAAVSQMIKSLEEEFKITLVIRSRSGVRLTPEGVALFPIIKNMVSNYRLLTEKVMEFTTFESGEIRIGISSEISKSYLSALVKDFSDIHTGVRFIIKQDYSYQLTDMLLQGEISIAFINHCEFPSISTEHIVTDHYSVAFNRDHYFSNYKSVSLGDLENESIIIDYNGVAENLKVAIAKAYITPQIKYTLYDIPSAIKMILSQKPVEARRWEMNTALFPAVISLYFS